MKNPYRKEKIFLQNGEDSYIILKSKINYISMDKKIIDNIAVVFCVLFIVVVSYFQG